MADQAHVTLRNVSFGANQAVGGAGGASSSPFGSGGGGGGGGLGGNGGINNGGGGGFQGMGGSNVGGGGGQFGNGGTFNGGGGGKFGAGGNEGGGGGGLQGAGGINGGGGGGQLGNGGNNNGGGGGSNPPPAGTGSDNGGPGGVSGGGSGSFSGNGQPGGPGGGGGGGNINGGNGGTNGGGGFGGNGEGPGNGGHGGANGGGGGSLSFVGGNGGTNGGGGGSGGAVAGNGGANGGGGGGVIGGNGGVNGGGGGGQTAGGNGGFGGGGGGSANAGGNGGFGGGDGGGVDALGNPVAGNGGSAFGGALFVKQGGTLTIVDSDLPTGNSVTPGPGFVNGVAAGTGIYLYNTDVNFQISGTSTVADEIGGTGGLIKSGLGTLNITGINTYTGTTVINQGFLNVTGQIIAPVVVNAAGTLTGTGQVGDTTVNGTIAPGDPGAAQNFGGVHVQPNPGPGSASNFGTLTVNGNFTQNQGSTYQVKIAPNQNDLIQVNGHAQINGGIIQILAANAAYQNGQTFTILTATGGVSGTYSGVSGTVPGFFGVTAIYDPNDVQIRISSSFQSVAATFNQKSVATYLDNASNAGTLPAQLDNQLRSLTPDQLSTALNELGGSTYASLLIAGRLRSMYLHQVLADQLRPGLGSNSPAPAVVRGQPPADDCNEDQTGFGRGVRGWSRMYGLEGRVADEINSFRYSFAGFQMGIEKLLGDSTRVGITGGYNYTSTNFDQLNSSASGSGGLIGLYGVQTWGNAYLFGALTNSFNRFGVDRFIAVGNINTVATGNVLQDEFNGLIESGYNQQFGCWFIQPLVGLQELTLHQSGTTERGSNGVGLNINGLSTDALWFSTGFRLARPFQDANNFVVPTFHARWVQDWHGEDRFISGALSNVGGSFLTQGATAGRNFLVTGLTVSANTGSFFKLVADYTFQTSGKQSSHTGSAGVQVNW